ncbi:MAG: NADH-quinone oxidoreductase subunit F, partial [Chloroflexi bacterium]|nr:NADH-quinone oxidoreductase subunit F [Chloroflexota bacterium]
MEAFAALQQQAQQVWQARQASPRPRIEVVLGSCSIAAGAQETLDAVREVVQGAGRDAEVGIVGDLGACWAEPIIKVTLPGQPTVLYGPIPAAEVPAFLDEVVARGRVDHPRALWAEGGAPVGRIPAEQDLPYFQIQDRRLIGRAGLIDPEHIDHYLATGGYAGFAKALGMVQGDRSQGQQDIIKVMLDSGLTGRGGANFPTGRKWDFLRTATATPKYMVCNADEGDPGAFVNRILLESDPHLTIEGMLIGCVAAGAEFGFIYIRDEYPLCIERMQRAVEQARERGLLGEDILGAGLTFDVEVWRGAGSY